MHIRPQSQYSVAANFGRVLAPTLQHMVETGRLDTNGGASPGKCLWHFGQADNWQAAQGTSGRPH